LTAGRSGGGLFLAALLAFVLFDLASLLSPRLSPLVPALPLPAVLAYALLGAFALALAFLTGTVAAALRARRLPPAGELLRAGFTLLVVAVHLTLLVGAARR